MIERNRSRFQVRIDSDLVSGVKAKLAQAGIDQQNILNAFLTYVAYTQKIPFQKLTKREELQAKAAAIFAADNEDKEIPEITNEKDLENWYAENGDNDEE